MGARERPGRQRRRRARRGTADGALRRARAPSRPAAAGVRRRGAVASAATRPPLRRRPHLLVPVLLAARRGAGGPAASLPHRRGLVRGVEPRLLAGVPGPRPGGSAGRCSGCARVCPSGRSASRGCTRTACARRACAARSRCWPGPTTGPLARADARRRAARACSPAGTSPRSRWPSIPPAVALARRRLPDLRAPILGNGPERAACGARGRRAGAGRRHRRPRVRRDGRGRGAHEPGAVPAAALAPGGVRAGGDRGRGAGDAQRRRRRLRQRRSRARQRR